MREFFAEGEKERKRGRAQQAALPVHDAAGPRESPRRQERRPATGDRRAATEQMSMKVRELWASLPRGTGTRRALRGVGTRLTSRAGSGARVPDQRGEIYAICPPDPPLRTFRGGGGESTNADRFHRVEIYPIDRLPFRDRVRSRALPLWQAGFESSGESARLVVDAGASAGEKIAGEREKRRERERERERELAGWLPVSPGQGCLRATIWHFSWILASVICSVLPRRGIRSTEGVNRRSMQKRSRRTRDRESG